jgi:ribosome biogenesis GTPase
MPRRGKEGERRPQAPKRDLGIGRGHGMHHRRGDGAPRPFATGRKRGEELQREGGWAARDDEELADLPARQKLHAGRGKAEEFTDAGRRGVRLAGLTGRGSVVEIQRGCCFVKLREPPPLPPDAKPIPGLLRAVPRGMLEQFDQGLASLVAVGDDVEVVVFPIFGDEEYEGMLASVAPRGSSFRRLHPSGRAVQVLAANVAQVVVVASTAEPDFRPGFVDRVLVCAAASDLPAVLVLNKVDLGVAEEDARLLEVYRGLGLRVLRTSAKTKEGLEELREVFAAGRATLCGHSGVGKSSLLLGLAPELADYVAVGAISDYTGRGTHTTSYARLYTLPFGEVIDTPGVREFTPANTDRQNLWAWFPEIAARHGRCGFSSCTHLHETNCAVLDAVEAGEIHPRRHESYARIYQTLPG